MQCKVQFLSRVFLHGKNSLLAIITFSSSYCLTPMLFLYSAFLCQLWGRTYLRLHLYSNRNLPALTTQMLILICTSSHKGLHGWWVSCMPLISPSALTLLVSSFTKKGKWKELCFSENQAGSKWQKHYVNPSCWSPDVRLLTNLSAAEYWSSNCLPTIPTSKLRQIIIKRIFFFCK